MVGLPQAYRPPERSVRARVEVGPGSVRSGDREAQRPYPTDTEGIGRKNGFTTNGFRAFGPDLIGRHRVSTIPPLPRRADGGEVSRRSSTEPDGSVTVVREPAPTAGPPRDSDERGPGGEAGEGVRRQRPSRFGRRKRGRSGRAYAPEGRPTRFPTSSRRRRALDDGVRSRTSVRSAEKLSAEAGRQSGGVRPTQGAREPRGPVRDRSIGDRSAGRGELRVGHRFARRNRIGRKNPVAPDERWTMVPRCWKGPSHA